MEVAPFRIEQYFARHEFSAPYMLSASDAETVTIGDLLALEPEAEEALHAQRLGYTESPGSPELRIAVAAVYETVAADDVVVTAAAEEGIFTAYHALLRPGDHVVVETPCYESALELARSTGAEVGEWRHSYRDGWAYDLDALERALRPDTRLLYVNTPHNPTGSHMSRDVLEGVVELAAEREAWLLCDEVYRELEHDEDDLLPAAADLYERALSLGSVSKTYGLPGLRLGWLASHDRDALARIVDFKHYTTICSSAPSEVLTAVALRNRHVLTERNRGIVRWNLRLLDEFLARHARSFSWVRPSAGPIGFPRLADGRDAATFCERVLAESGVLLLPGSVYDEPQHLRVGFGRASFPESLGRLDDWLGGRDRRDRDVPPGSSPAPRP